MSRLSRRRVVLVVAGFAFLFGMWHFVGWLYYRYTHAVTEDAFVKADIVNVAPLVPGHIKRILVDESQRVKKGQLLFEIDPKDYVARVRVARAQVEYAKSRLRVLKKRLAQVEDAYRLTEELVRHQIDAARHDLAQARAQFERVKRDYRRFSRLYKKRVIGKRKFDLVVEEFKRTSELVKIKEAKLAMALARRREVEVKRKQVEEVREEIEAARRAVKKAEEALKLALVQLEHTKVKSPVDGIVAKKYLFEGDFAASGYPVLAVYDTSGIYVLANLEETRFEGVKVGAPVDIWVDAYPGRRFKGRVMKILRASAAEFALIPRDVTAGEFTKVVQRIPIKIALEGDARRLLIPGMSVEIGIKK